VGQGALDGKVVLVTGSAKRVGAAISRRLHAAGASLILHYRSSKTEAQALQTELNGARANSAATVQANLLNAAELPELVRTTVSRFGRLDVLVNNASSFHPTPIGEIKLTDWDDLIGTNLKAPLFLAQAAAPHLKKANGCIVNITDIHAERPLKHYAVYSVAKAGLAGLTRSLARDLGPEVRVNGVAPGPILWPDDGSFDEVARQRVISHTLLKRAGEPEDIAAAVHFLVAEAPFVTGQIIAVDGGRSVNL
jgi:pteridine reductase